MSMKKSASLAIALGAMACAGQVLAAGYGIQFLDASIGQGPDYAVNNSGVVAGTPGVIVSPLSYVTRAAVWDTSSGGSPVAGSSPLGGWAGMQATAAAINNSGMVVGTLGVDASQRPYLAQGGSAGWLPVPAGLSNAQAVGINDAGDVVGYAWGQAYGERHVLTWRNGVVSDLSVLPGGVIQSGVANAINASGAIVGAQGLAGYTMRAAVWIDGVMSYLPRQGNAVVLSKAQDINDAGQIVGGTTMAGGGYAAAIWENGGIRTFEGLLPGTSFSDAVAINNRGQVLINVYGGPSRAYLLEDGKLIDLAEAAGLPVISAWDINDAGQIVARTASGQHVLLTPVPEPATLVLMAGGLAGAAWMARRRRGA